MSCPDVCETHWHLGWGNGRWYCELNRTSKLAEEESGEDPYNPSSVFDEMYERQLANRNAAVVAAHIPAAPTSPVDVDVLRNAERQLKSLTPWDMHVLGLLASSDVYPLNGILRSGGSLNVKAGHHGRYATQQEFHDDASDIFKQLGAQIALDAQMTLFRGVGIPLAYSPDIAGLGSHLSRGTPWHSTFTDDGFGFAATNPETALGYDGTGNGRDAETLLPALFELTVHSGLCLPEERYRSTGLLTRTLDGSMLDTDMSQVVFPPGTQWKITDVQQNSDYTLVRVTQI